MRFFLVTPWFGVGSGGAESAARWIASSLSTGGFDVAILTTVLGNPFAKTPMNLSPSAGSLGGIRVTRFNAEWAVDGDLAGRIEGRGDLTDAEEERFLRGNVSSPEMERFIGSHTEDLFIFIPYCFGTTIFGIEKARKAIIVPCLHDEGAARLRRVGEAMKRAEGVVFLSPPEAALFEGLYGKPERFAVTGMGIETPARGDPERFRAKFGIDGPYWLTLGRRHEAKGSFQVIVDYSRYFTERKVETPILVTAGPGDLPEEFKNSRGVLDVGLLPEALKWDALSGCFGLINPSLLESFSIAIMDAWHYGKPVVVNECCPVTLFHAEESNGGLWYGDYPTFAAALDFLISDPHKSAVIGEQGREYVRREFDPDVVKEKLNDFFWPFQTLE